MFRYFNIGFIVLIFFKIESFSQAITWTDITTNYSLPEGVKIFKGQRASPLLNTWYLDVDMNRTNIAIKPYLNPSGKEKLTSFVQRMNAIAGINGGYFDLGSNSSYSALVNPNSVLAKNISSVVRDSKTYTLTRSFFGFTDTRELAIDWIYHFGNRPIDVYRYEQPTPNAPGVPAPTPSPANGLQYYELLAGIGGGPTLVKNKQVNITYDQEVFWGSGVGKDNRDPRTAVGYTKQNHVIMIVADGRQASSDGVSLPELAQIMIDLNCIEAMNLDGGGSTQMAVGNVYVNNPSEQRAIPTMLAVVVADSIPLLPPVFFNKKIDTGDSSFCKLIGNNWSISGISGYWGKTFAMIAPIGNGDNYAEFKLNLPKPSSYQIDAWWVSTFDRAKDTPFIIKHKNGTDTIRIDQSINGTRWNKIGVFNFNGDSTDKVLISNFATQGNFVVADAIRILSQDSTLSSSKEKKENNLPTKNFLYQNYPNPFNPVTRIKYMVVSNLKVSLKVFDILGNEIVTLVDEVKDSGEYEVEFNNEETHRGVSLPSGVYFYQLIIGNFITTKKFVLLK